MKKHMLMERMTIQNDKSFLGFSSSPDFGLEFDSGSIAMLRLLGLQCKAAASLVAALAVVVVWRGSNVDSWNDLKAI